MKLVITLSPAELKKDETLCWFPARSLVLATCSSNGTVADFLTLPDTPVELLFHMNIR